MILHGHLLLLSTCDHKAQQKQQTSRMYVCIAGVGSKGGGGGAEGGMVERWQEGSVRFKDGRSALLTELKEGKRNSDRENDV